ncbi:MAG: NUDIX hydrolase [Bacillota bacterium]
MTEDSELKFAGRVMRVRVDRIGEGKLREVAEVGSVSCVLAVRTAKDRSPEILMVRQYRHPTGRWLWEIPAGRVDPGETPLECARRELAEETGYRASQWRHLGGFYSSPGFTDEFIDVYHASGLEAMDRPPAGDEDDIRHRWVALEDIMNWRRCRLLDGKTLSALSLWWTMQICRPRGCNDLDRP